MSEIKVIVIKNEGSCASWWAKLEILGKISKLGRCKLGDTCFVR